jgi:streptogramin lyase
VSPFRGGKAVVGIAAVLALASLWASPAHAITPTIRDFTEGLNPSAGPSGITAGPDGNLWFNDAGKTKAIGRITLAGAVDEFSTGLNAGSYPLAITAGPDGNLWFADDGTKPAIGRITVSGAVAEFELSAGSAPMGIAAGPDGKLWFTDSGSKKAIGVIDPTTDAINEFSTGLNAGSSPTNITAGPGGKLWFTDLGTTKAIGVIDPTTDAISEYSAGLNFGSSPYGIAPGPDGRLWFTDEGTTKALGVIDPTTHAISEPSTLTGEDYPYGIATGPEGGLWFGDEGAPKSWFGRVTIGGTAERFEESSGRIPEFVAAGPDGDMWFTGGGAIERVTTPPTAKTLVAAATAPTSAIVNGTTNGHAQPTSFHVEYGPVGGATATTAEQSLGTTSGEIAVSAALGGLMPSATYQARVVVTNPTGTAAGTFLTFATPTVTVLESPTSRKDVISNFKLTPPVLIAARRGGPVASAGRRTGSIVSYTGTQAATTTFNVQRAVAGRIHGRSCLKPTRRNRKARRCTRYLSVGSFTHSDNVGANRFRFTGRIHGHQLAPRRYQLRAVPHNAAGAGRAAVARFGVKL